MSSIEISDKPITVNTSQLDNYLAESTLPLVLDCYADWCPPCRYIEPIYIELAKEFENRIIFLRLNTDNNRKRAMDLQITGIPSFFFYKEGKLVEKIIGADPKKLKKSVDKLLKD